MEFTVCDLPMKQLEVPFKFRPRARCVHALHNLYQFIVTLIDNGNDFVVEPDDPHQLESGGNLHGSSGDGERATAPIGLAETSNFVSATISPVLANKVFVLRTNEVLKKGQRSSRGERPKEYDFAF